MIAVAGPALAPEVAARRAASQPGGFWLCGPAADDEAQVGRDMVGTRPVRVVRGNGAAVLSEVEEVWRDERARWALTGSSPTGGIPIGVGWFSYELGHELVAPAAARAPANAGWPMIEVHFYDAVWLRDERGAAILARDAAAAARLEALLGRSVDDASGIGPRLGALSPVHDDSQYLAGVRRVLEYLAAGDVYQVNLARALRAPFPTEDTIALAGMLRRRAPAPHAAVIAASDGQGWIVGNSPERFLACDGAGMVETRPIKGTRPRGSSATDDGAATRALVSAEKDRAEHVMIVDLERNDLGRICRTGSIEVVGPARVLTLPTVIHLVSTIGGVLRERVGLTELFAATFPGGSITGAPKRRAMEIIAELEPERRGPYTGATGWLGAAGDLDLAVAIRTALVRDGVLSLSVGGGIVADSSPESELAETEVKARAFASLARGGASAPGT